MLRKKITLALDAHQDLSVEQEFVQQYFSENGCHVLALFMVGPTNLRNLQSQARSFRNAWLEAEGCTGPMHFHRESIADLATLHQTLTYSDALIVRWTLWSSLQKQYPGLNDSFTQGPVIIIPDSPSPIEQVVLLQEDSLDSWMAIKQFIYLFPQLRRNIKATAVIPCAGHAIQGDSQKEKLMISYLRYHFPDLGLVKSCDADEHTLALTMDLSKPTLLIGSGNHLYGLPGFQDVTSLTKLILSHSVKTVHS